MLDRLHKHRVWVVVYFLICTLFLIGDPILDIEAGESWLHILVETSMILVVMVGVAIISFDVRRERRRRRHLEADLLDAHGDAAKWRQEAQSLLAGLGTAIDRQFQRWGLTPAERDVGILLLKGLSHKEIAEVRQTSERTVRQQARELYRKASVSGRAELSAWFLEDLLLPDSAAGARDTSAPREAEGGPA